MLITTRMTRILAAHRGSQKSSPSIYGAFMAAHFFSDKFNYARRAHTPFYSPPPPLSLSRARFFRDECRHDDFLSGGRVIVIKREERVAVMRCNPV